MKIIGNEVEIMELISAIGAFKHPHPTKEVVQQLLDAGYTGEFCGHKVEVEYVE